LQIKTINLATMDHLNRRVLAAVMGVFLILLLMATGYNLMEGIRNYRLKSDYREKIARLEASMPADEADMASEEEVKDLLERVGLANRLIAQDRFPWITVLSAIESTIPGEVILKRFMPSSDFLSVNLSGSATNVNELVRFHKALEGSGLFESVNLTTMSLNQLEAGGSAGADIQFEIDGRFRMEALFTGPDGRDIKKALQKTADG
jgi:hypothetical protein